MKWLYNYWKRGEMTKRRDLVKELMKAGFAPDGGTNHEIFKHPDGRKICVPRHRELKENLVKGIRKQAGLR